MEEKSNQLKSGGVPLAKAYRMSELPGRINKLLDVPPGKQGIVLREGAPARFLPSGRHPIVFGWERLFGKSAGVVAGYLPTSSFTGSMKAEYILSGDGELLDTRLALALEVADAESFFRQQIMALGEIPSEGLDLSSDDQLVLLRGLVRQYGGDDLIAGLPIAHLKSGLYEALEPALSGQGLRLLRIDLMAFWPSVQRAEIAEKIQALNSRLQDVELEEKMSKLESQVQLKEFIQQLAPELTSELGAQSVLDENLPEVKNPLHPAVIEEKRPNLGERIRSWLKLQAAAEGNNRHWTLEKLFPMAEKEDSGAVKKLPRKLPQRWWLPRVTWIGFVVLSGYWLTRLVTWLSQDAPQGSRIEILLAIWGFVILAILESLKALVEKRENLVEKAYPLPGITYIDDIVGHDKTKLDQLVREQIGRELAQTRDALNELRRRVYQAGDIDMALTIKELERKIEQRNIELQRPEFGKPLYLQELRISSHAGNDMIDYDEDLLLYANALNDKAHIFQDRFTVHELNMDDILGLENELDQLHHRFAMRARALKLSEN